MGLGEEMGLVIYREKTNQNEGKGESRKGKLPPSASAINSNSIAVCKFDNCLINTCYIFLV